MMGKRLFAAAALLLLALPVLLAPWGLDMRSYRSDTLTASFAEDPAGFLADRLALRNAAITLRSRLLGLIGESGSEQVIRGREGFLYFQPTIADHQGTAPLTAEERSALAAKLAALRDELASQGRGLIVLIAPDKCAVYPEYMPARYPRTQELRASQWLNRNCAVSMIDAEYRDVKAVKTAVTRLSDGNYEIVRLTPEEMAEEEARAAELESRDAIYNEIPDMLPDDLLDGTSEAEDADDAEESEEVEETTEETTEETVVESAEEVSEETAENE